MVFDRLKVERIHSADLLTELCSDEESAWATYNRGKPVALRQLAKRLNEFGIAPKQLKIKFENRNGYELAQFADAFTRYLASPTDLSSTPLQASAGEPCSDFSNSTDDPAKSLSSTSKPNTGAACRGVEDKTPVLEGSAENEAKVEETDEPDFEVF